MQALADVERAHALGRVQLVAGEGEHVHVQCFYVDGHMPNGLHGVGVEQRPVRFGDLAQFGDGLDGADLVVGVHDGNDGRLRPERLFKFLRMHQPELVHRQIGDFKALLFQLLAGVQHGVVLDLRGDDVVALIPAGVGRAADGPIVALGAAAGEVDLRTLRAQRRRHLPARPVQRRQRLAAKAVYARGIAVDIAKVGLHGLKHRLDDPRGGRVVHIDSHLFVPP